MEGMALCRRESAIVATALDSGAELWRVRDLPLHRPQPESRSGDRGRWIAMAGDMGRYALGLGDRTVYALNRLSALGADPEAADGSLTALAVGRDAARTIWEIGNGKGNHPSTRESKCLTVPTVHAGRLYALARLGNRYVALCLDAATGNLVWERLLGVVPMRGGSEFSALQACAVEMVTERGSPPAVAGGIAVFLTNSGVLAGLDAATGAPVWAYRYDSRVSGAAAGPATVNAQGQALLLTTLRRPCLAANPVILDQDRAICLPCDSDFVLALHARTGELLWRRERGGQEELTAAGDSRLLLTGPDMAVLRAEDGAVLYRREAAILGRPAVADGQVFASGKGSVLHMDLAGFAVSETPVGDGKVDLGNLTAAPGGLIAAHAGGLSAWRIPGISLPRQP
jgi:outer membrane protein assembly factor BamB